jgi:hypothetical protein
MMGEIISRRDGEMMQVIRQRDTAVGEEMLVLMLLK